MRQLAAILFADMTGYTALMQENEHLARQKRQRLKEVLEATISLFNGKILQYYGDGSLSIFSSALDSVHCAVDIQRQLQQAPRVELRMGIHTGDVTVEEGAIYGDGVNLASRIESLAVPGSIFISEKVYDEIRNQENILTREMGFFELKNVKRPIRVFAIANSGIVVPNREELRGKTAAPVNRLAVLPFVNMSADPDNEYFSDGITEELLNALTRVDGLQVTSRTSAFAFKGKNDDIRDIAIQLNVDKVLEGSVRKAGSRVRITAQLINAADGFHIWSETYDRHLTDIFEVQDEISGIIANKLRENLAPPQQNGNKAKTPAKNVMAYTHYLKGLHFWNKGTPDDLRKAIDCFQQTIAIDPEYAPAYAYMSGCYSYLGGMGQMVPGKAFELVHRYADEALRLNDALAEGYVAKASGYLLYDWQWARAYEALQKAIQLNPSDTDAYELLSMYYVIDDQLDKAVAIIEEAAQIDPLSTVIIQAAANNYIMTGRYDDALREADKLLEMHPDMRSAFETKGWASCMKGDYEQALEYFKEYHRLINHPLKGQMGMGFCYAKMGMREEALECIRKMEQRQQEDPDSVLDADLAAVWVGLGDLDKTFYHLEQCVEKRLGPIAYFLHYPPYDPIKKDPRYAALLKRIGK